MTPSDVVAWLGAVQAQEYPLAKWSVAQRLAGHHTELDLAIADGSILRTHVLRPTWHFVARDDLRWMQTLTSARVLRVMSRYDGRHGIDAALIGRSLRLITAAIERHGHLTRRAVADVLSRAGISTSAWVVGELLMHAELRALVCSGVPDAGHQTYALVDERAPTPSSMPRDEALAALTKRYFQSHGPATARDYQWWSGLAGTDVTHGIHLLGQSVDRVRIGNRDYLTVGPRVPPKRATAHLIQPFDELVVGYRESRDVVDVRRAVRTAAAGTPGLLTRAIVYDGQIVARWQLERLRGAPTVLVQPVRRLTAAERATISAAATRFATFFGGGKLDGQGTVRVQVRPALE